MTAGFTLDAAPLIGLDKNDRSVIALLAGAREAGARITVPASALAQAIRNPARQARLARLIRHPNTDVVPLDRGDATLVGRLLATRVRSDVVDAHVVVCARRTGQPVVTADPKDMRRLDPLMRIVDI